MYKKTYEKPCMYVYEVESTAILAGSGGAENKPVPGKSKTFNLENDQVISGDDDDVWE